MTTRNRAGDFERNEAVLEAEYSFVKNQSRHNVHNLWATEWAVFMAASVGLLLLLLLIEIHIIDKRFVWIVRPMEAPVKSNFTDHSLRRLLTTIRMNNWMIFGLWHSASRCWNLTVFKMTHPKKLYCFYVYHFAFTNCMFICIVFDCMRMKVGEGWIENAIGSKSQFFVPNRHKCYLEFNIFAQENFSPVTWMTFVVAFRSCRVNALTLFEAEEKRHRQTTKEQKSN